MMGVQDAHTGTHKTACYIWFDISNALSKGRRWNVEPYCDSRRDMGITYHSWIKTADLAPETYWLAEKEKFKQTFSTWKIICTSFWDRQGVLLVDVLPQRTTTKSAVYCETLKKIRRAIKNKNHGMLSTTILLLHDNARPHRAAQTQDLIISFKW
jgi:hypothetical protein